MYYTYLILIFCTFTYTVENSVIHDNETMCLNLFGQLENIKKSIDLLNLRMDLLTDKYTNMEISKKDNQKNINLIYDDSIDTLPNSCETTILPSNCTKDMACSQRSGYYDIAVPHYRNNVFTVFCDFNNFEGGWLYILRRVDGSENFARSWSDYVNGFGDVAGEHWIGLENLYALTNFNGPQELYVYIENFEEGSAFAHYDNFVIRNSSEKYKLKSLGRYTGTAGDGLSNQIGCKFSTFDSDNDEAKRHCADVRKGGFWFKDCSYSNPTGKYLNGKYNTEEYEGAYWHKFGGSYYSHKTIIFMIRNQRTPLF